VSAREAFAPVVSLTTVAGDETAGRLARALVEERLAACVTRFHAARSVYRWKGAIEDEDEVLLVIKSSRDRWRPLETRLRELHPYDVPEMLCLPVEAGHAPYLQWLEEGTRPVE